MNVSEAVSHMIEKAGKSKAGVSTEIGKSRNFITASQAREWRPQVDTLMAIAGACGYSLALEGNGERLVIDPAGASRGL